MRPKFRLILLITLLTLFLLEFPLRGDIIHLKDGRKVEGQIVEESDIELRLRIQEGIFLTVKKENVEKIEKKKTHFEICQEKLAQAKVAKDFEAVLIYFRDEKLKNEDLFTKIKQGLISARKRENPDTYCQRCNAWGEIPCPECGGKGYKEEPCTLCDENGMVVCPKCAGTGKVSCYGCGGKGKVPAICGRCGGKGYVACGKCGGDGWITCPRCGGDGTLRCHNCRGTGKITERAQVWDSESGWIWVTVKKTCPTCGGTGKIVCLRCKGAGGWPCPACLGKGRLRCEACGGKGKVIITCRMCQGRGWLYCSRCGRKGKIVCPHCHGTKIAKIPCKNCEGKGVITCPECSGTGIKKQGVEIPPDPQARQPGK